MEDGGTESSSDVTDRGRVFDTKNAKHKTDRRPVTTDITVDFNNKGVNSRSFLKKKLQRSKKEISIKLLNSSSGFMRKFSVLK